MGDDLPDRHFRLALPLEEPDRLLVGYIRAASFHNVSEPTKQRPTPLSTGNKLILFIAQGFGTGRIPKAPGTWGSVLGLAWFALLLWLAGHLLLVAGVLMLASIVASVWNCAAAERILGRKDPGSVVIDEIVAVPLCFLGSVFHLTLRLGEVPSVDLFFGPSTWYLALGVFLAFRFFDITKPWPVKQSQNLPNGWGVVLDDLLAAVYVNLVILLVHLALQFL
jgi:phosphatidylglycerophosphatase A